MNYSSLLLSLGMICLRHVIPVNVFESQHACSCLASVSAVIKRDKRNLLKDELGDGGTNKDLETINKKLSVHLEN